MNRKKIMIVGSGGREAIFAKKLIEDSQVFAVMGHANPTIIDCVKETKGEYIIGNVNDGKLIASFSKANHIDFVFVNADEPLSKGVVDILLNENIKAIGGTKESTRIEWDKIYSIEMMQKVCPKETPFFIVISDKKDIKKSIDEFKNRNLELVVKPQGLTGGKGVKVMPEHLKDYDEARQYIIQLLLEKPDEKVLLVEKLQGIEFTIMGITDGENMVMAPASYDYPFRFEDDQGDGTGGMGCFTSNENKLPFMNDHDWESCRKIMQSIIDEMAKKGLGFNGVLNGGFFKTAKGIQFMEFNARFGDPEGINVLMLLEGSFSQLLENIWNKKLSNENTKFIKKASVTKYLVAKEYPHASAHEIIFDLNESDFSKEGLQILFGACERDNNTQFKTLKKSRVLSVGAVSDTIEEASTQINEALEKYFKGSLEYRKDIGSTKSLDSLKKKNKGLS